MASTGKIYKKIKYTATKIKSTIIITKSSSLFHRLFQSSVRPKGRRNRRISSRMVYRLALRSSVIVIFFHSLMLSDLHFRWRPLLSPTSTVSCILILQRMLFRVTWPNLMLHSGEQRFLSDHKTFGFSLDFLYVEFHFICVGSFNEFVWSGLGVTITTHHCL